MSARYPAKPQPALALIGGRAGVVGIAIPNVRRYDRVNTRTGFSMRMLLACLIAIFALARPVIADEVTTYVGKIGSLPIIVELALPDEDGAFAGRYAYLSTGADIPLHGVQSANGHKLVFEEEKPCTKALCKPADTLVTTAPIAADWTLKRAAHRLTGTWRDRESGKSLPISLKYWARRDVPDYRVLGFETLDPIEVAGAGNPPLLTPDQLPYDFLKQAGPLDKGEVTTIGDSAYRMDRDKRTGVTYPTVLKLGGYDTRPLNAYLRQQRLQSALPIYSCLSSAYLGNGWGDFGGQGTKGFEDGDADVSVGYFTTRLMQVGESGSFYCGGAYPENFSRDYLVDARTGKPLAAETLLAGWVARNADGQVVDPKTVKDQSTLTFGPDDKLQAFILSHLNKDIDAATKSDCGTEDLIRTNLGVYFNEDEMVFTFKDLPHVIFACTEDLARVPLKDARPFLTEQGAKYFAVLDR
jgi:hypothetical protein